MYKKKKKTKVQIKSCLQDKSTGDCLIKRYFSRPTKLIEIILVIKFLSLFKGWQCNAIFFYFSLKCNKFYIQMLIIGQLHNVFKILSINLEDCLIIFILFLLIKKKVKFTSFRSNCIR